MAAGQPGPYGPYASDDEEQQRQQQQRQAQAGGCRRRRRKKKKGDNGSGDSPDCGCDSLDCCGCDFLILMQFRMLLGALLSVLGLGRTVQALSREAGAPRGFVARRMHTAVRYYQVRISPGYGPRCRYTPTCSEYAVTALRRHGALRGGILTLRRLARCRPNGGYGSDPVPER